jgi:hypothetical protein
MKFDVIEIDVSTFEGMIPTGYDLVEYAAGTDPVADSWFLTGFDEVGFFVKKNAKHVFVGTI